MRTAERGEISPLKADIMFLSLSTLFSIIVSGYPEGVSRYLDSAAWFSTFRRKLCDFIKHHKPISLRRNPFKGISATT